ncbi:MAG: arcB, partial [Sediminibacterium sp.]|nr:arcB [Sediminibacterium sp.]
LFHLSFYGLLAMTLIFIGFTCIIIRQNFRLRKKNYEQVAILNRELETRVEEKIKEIIEQEKRYHAVLDQMMEGAQIISRGWRYVYINEAAARQTRFPVSELVGHTMMEKHPGIEHTDLFKKLEECMKGECYQLMETEFIFPDGSKGYYQLSIQPVPEGIFILSMDISERKKGEQQNVTHIKELEEILFKLSHEVRHPVSNILGVAELFAQKLVSPEDSQTLVDSMKQSAIILDGYVRELSVFVNSLKLKK